MKVVAYSNHAQCEFDSISWSSLIIFTARDISIFFRSSGSKSVFSSLLLANYEQQMQFDPTANYSSNYAFETRREISTEMNREKCKLKPKVVDNKEKFAGGEEEKGEVVKSICESPDEPPDEIILKVDPFVSKFLPYFPI